jgi:hypothetical protein
MSPARTLLFIFRWGIFLLACIHIYTQLTSAKGNQSLHALWAMLKAPQLLFITGMVFILMLVNWAIESVKWRKLLEPFAPIGHWRAFKATIAGTSLALISPNRTGEFVGRVMFLPPGQRYRGAVATMLGGVAQFLVTLIAGVIALLLMTRMGHRYGLDGDLVILALTALTMIVIVLVLLLYFHPSLLVRILYRWPLLRRWHSDLAILEHYSVARLTSIFVISCFRYVVFTGQFVLLLSIFEGGPSLMDATLAVPVIFLVATLIPTVLLTELGIRGSVALAILGPTGAAEGTILLATFAIWMINLMVPAIAGSLILITARIRTSGEGK